jgi:hypothetical protein
LTRNSENKGHRNPLLQFRKPQDKRRRRIRMSGIRKGRKRRRRRIIS